MRITFDEYALRLAEVAAMRSEDPHLKVGAVIMDQEHRILATGYNGLSSGIQAPGGFWQDRDAKSRYMLHAEMNACSLILRGQGHTMATTISPCSMCARIIAAQGIKEVVFRTLYDRDPEAIDILKFHGVNVIHLAPSNIEVLKMRRDWLWDRASAKGHIHWDTNYDLGEFNALSWMIEFLEPTVLRIASLQDDVRDHYLYVLNDRASWLEQRIAAKSKHGRESRWDHQERQALLWALSMQKGALQDHATLA